MHPLTVEKPYPDETLMSFSERGSQDASLGWPIFQRIVFSVRFHSSRPTELRYFDWRSLSEKFGLSEDELFSLSERSHYVLKSDPMELSARRLWFAPWTQDEGYACYSPAALQKQFYLRRSWLLPGQIVDRENGCLMLTHCSGCGCRLRDQRWPHAYPACPCGHDLFEEPMIPTPPKIRAFSEKLGGMVDAVFKQKPAYLLSDTATLLTGMWYVVRVLEQHRLPKKLYQYLISKADVGPYRFPDDSDKVDVGQSALRNAQLWAAADAACSHEPVLRRYRHVLALTKNAKQCMPAVERGLRELAESLS